MDAKHWFILAACLFGAVVVIGIGPFAGYLIQRHNRRASERFVREAQTERFFRVEANTSHRVQPVPDIQVFGMRNTRIVSVVAGDATVTETHSTLDAELVYTPRLDDTLGIDMAVLVEPTEAELAFEADPLGSWCYPTDAEFEETPLAIEAMAYLIAEERVVGVEDVDAEWREWNLSLELVAA